MRETIAAIATAYGEGGIGIIRISGEDAKNILDKLFVSDFEIKNKRMTYGYIVDQKNRSIVDEVLAVYMKAPYTYTAEDVVEIQCHGSVVSIQKILKLVLENGARLADRGEFTKRAFLNGRIDLSQAEAVIDIIKARTEKSFDVAINQLQGGLTEKIQNIRKQIMDILVDITVNIDYPDEDIEIIVYDKLSKNIGNIIYQIEKLIKSADTGRILNEGLKVAIIGKPNVGKSSFMNVLLNEKRAIVTDIPGTTRDVIEENINLDGIPINLIDTAGIRDTDDKIEKIGIEKSKQKFNEADLIIFIVDMSKEIEDEDIYIAKTIGKRKAILLANKIDIKKKIDLSEITRYMPNVQILETSMVEEKGIEELKEIIKNMVYSGETVQNESIVVNNVRHVNLLENAKISLEDAKNMVNMEEPLEFVEIDVKSSYETLGEVIGETVTDDVIDEVFKRFCLGK